MSVFKQLQRRGLIAQTTHPEEIERKLEEGPVTFYIGFDATADSLHVGHMLQLIVMRHMQLAGHRPIALLGTGTTMIGDPTGRTDMRQMLMQEEIQKNANIFQSQMEKILDFSDGKALFLKNGDWLLNLNYIEFLRDVGRHFSVNKMLTAESIKTRMERGLSFLEFNYMLMQSYDFLRLYEDYGCTMQLGGDDQWSNILGGIDLIRRAHQDTAYGMTFTLLTNREGKKMGKTQSGAVWLDPQKFSPYDFFQYWRNVDDADVIRFLKMLTFLPIEEIEEMESWEGSQLNKAKEILAFELTKLVHGEEEAQKALKTTQAIFSGASQEENMPTTTLKKDDFTDGKIGLLALLVACGLCKSNGEARRLITQGGIAIDGTKAEDASLFLSESQIKESPIVIKKGKKTYHKVEVE